MLPVPVLLLGGPLLLALLLFPWRRWPRATAVAGVVAALGLRLLIAAAPLAAAPPAGRFFGGDTWLIFGRPLMVSEAIRDAILLLLAVLALLYAVSLLWPQGANFVPASLALLTPLAAALMIRPFVFGVLALLMAAALLAGIIQAGRAGSIQAALRCLLITALAAPLLLVAGWMLEADAVALAATVARLMGVGLVMLLAGFPFHIWVAPAMVEAPPLAAVVIFGLTPLVIFLFIFGLWQQWPAIPLHPSLAQLLRWSGALTVITAALLAYNAASFGSLLGYLLLADIGASLLLLAVAGPEGAPALLSLLFLRIVSLIVAGSGLSLIRQQHDATDFSGAPGAVGRSPLGVALYIYGGLSLAGLPLTPGFSGRWAVIALLADSAAANPSLLWLAAALLLAAVSGAIGLLRGLVLLLAPAPRQSVAVRPQPLWFNGAGAAILLSGLFVAFFPQIILASVLRLAALFN